MTNLVLLVLKEFTAAKYQLMENTMVKTKESNTIPPVIGYIAYFLLGTFVLVFFGGVIVYGDQFPTVHNGFLLKYSIGSFLIGFIILISRWISISIGAGLFIFFVLIGLSVVYSNNTTVTGRLAGICFPLSIVFLIGWCYWFIVGSNRAAAKKLLKEGVSAPAAILSIERTGVNVKINTDYPHYGVVLKVKVHPAADESFESEAGEILAEHEIANLSQGMNITVRYNPKNKKRVAVESW